MRPIRLHLTLYDEGIGVETARALATAHAHVIITARDMTTGEQVVKDLKASTGNEHVEVMQLDLSSLQSVREFVERFRARHLPIHILICKCRLKMSLFIDENPFR